MLHKKLSEKIEIIDVSEDGVYLVKDGELKKLKAPVTGYGTQRIIWQHGKVIRVEVTESELF